jgi:two-component sensor histidine kinase
LTRLAGRNGRREDEPDANAVPGVPARRRSGLLTQIAVLLTVAIIPVGMVAVLQTQRAIDTARQVYLDSLRAKTMEAATPEREGIMRVMGLARGLTDAVGVFGPDGPACRQLMQRSAATNQGVLFVGLIEPPGISSCNNMGQEFDFTANNASADLFAEPRGDVRFNPAGDITGVSVVILSEPAYAADGTFLGFISISYPASRLHEGTTTRDDTSPAVVLFNARGEILSTTAPEQVPDVLPRNRPLADLVQGGRTEFAAPSEGGQLRDYAVVPIAPGRAYALGSWIAPETRVWEGGSLVTTLAFPLVMWAVSLTVALVSLHQLVIHPIRDLGRRMRGFADGRRILHAGSLPEAPGEISEIGETFETMARRIIRDEADLENTLFEREVLLKEVHHRVKNNLQLMSSILNMQARKASSPEARQSLRDVQERLRSLAAIHRGLYQAPELSQVQFDDLLREIAGQLLALAPATLDGVEPKLALESVRLVPDQAAPLAMLTTEMMTNALKYMGTDAAGRRHITIALRKEHRPEGPEEITVEVVNSVAPGTAEDRPDGLGRRLIEVLAQQLAGRVETHHDPDCHAISVHFTRAGFEPADAPAS